MKPTSMKSTLHVASAIVVILVICMAALPQAAYGWFARPVPPNLVTQTRTYPPASSVPVLRLPAPHVGLATPLGARVVGPLYTQRRDPFEPMRGWVECVNAYNTARRREGLGVGARFTSTARVQRPFAPCGPPPGYGPAPTLFRQPAITLPHISAGPPRLLPVPNGGELR
jgi:hypothetical protein